MNPLGPFGGRSAPATQRSEGFPLLHLPIRTRTHHFNNHHSSAVAAMSAAHELPDQIPQALADQVQAASKDPSILRSLRFDRGYINRTNNHRVFRLEQTGEEVSARVYNLWSENGPLIESKRATNAGIYYLVIQGGQYQEPVLVAKTEDNHRLRVWRGIDLGLDAAGGIILEDPAAPTTPVPTTPAPQNIESPVPADVQDEPFLPAHRFSGPVRPSAPPAPFSPAPSVPRSDVSTVIKPEDGPFDFDFGTPFPQQQELHHMREQYVIEDTPMVMNGLEDNELAAIKAEPAIKREPSIEEIFGPLNAPQAPPQQYAAAQYPAAQYPAPLFPPPIFPVPQYGYNHPGPQYLAPQHPAPRIYFHFLDAAGNRRRTREYASCANSAALWANVRAVHPYAPAASLDVVFAQVTGPGPEIPLVRHDDEDWNALVADLKSRNGVLVVDVDIRVLAY